MRTAALVLGVAALALAACGQGGRQAETSPPAEKTPEQIKAMVATLPAPYNTGDPERGKSVFGMCRSCHSVAKGGPNMTGPHNYGVVGSKAGAQEDYNYSEALKTSGIVWDAPTLDKWIENPRQLVPGTKMSFAGVKDPKDRVDLIAYLRTQADS